MKSADKNRSRIKLLFCCMLMAGIAFIGLGCGKKADPIPKNPFKPVTHIHEFYSVL